MVFVQAIGKHVEEVTANPGIVPFDDGSNELTDHHVELRSGCGSTWGTRGNTHNDSIVGAGTKGGHAILQTSHRLAVEIESEAASADVPVMGGLVPAKCHAIRIERLVFVIPCPKETKP